MMLGEAEGSLLKVACCLCRHLSAISFLLSSWSLTYIVSPLTRPQVVEEAVVGDVADGLYSMAALARASQVTLLPETGEYLVVLEGVGRVSAGAIEDVDGYLTGER